MCSNHRLFPAKSTLRVPQPAAGWDPASSPFFWSWEPPRCTLKSIGSEGHDRAGIPSQRSKVGFHHSKSPPVGPPSAGGWGRRTSYRTASGVPTVWAMGGRWTSRRKEPKESSADSHCSMVSTFLSDVHLLNLNSRPRITRKNFHISSLFCGHPGGKSMCSGGGDARGLPHSVFWTGRR